MRLLATTTLAALALAVPVHVRAQPADPPADPCDVACENRRVGESWSQSTGQPTPAPGTDAAGTRRLEWHGSASAKAQSRRIEPGGPGRANTPETGGAYGLLNVTSELRLPELEGDAANLQFAAQASNDRAAMALYPSQVQNLSAARQWSGGLQVQAGDQAANFSALALQLGYRGASLQRTVAGFEVAALAGTLADSWDSLFARTPLGGQPARSRYLRDVAGLNLARRLGERSQVHVSFGAYRDRAESLPEERRMLPAASGRTFAVGFQWQGESLTLSGEAARSRFDDGQSGGARDANALLLDAAWRFERGQLRTGLRRIGAVFTAPGAAMQPGLEELFVGGDLAPWPWLQLNADLRRTGQRVAATEISPAQRSHGVRAQLGANVSLAAWLEGLSANLQGSFTEQHEASGSSPRQGQAGATLSWQRPTLSASIGLTENRSRTPGFAQGASDNHGLRVQLGRPFGQYGGSGWSGQLSANAGVQVQQLPALGLTGRNVSFGLALQAQRAGVAQLGAAFQQSTGTPPGGGLRLTQRQFQFDAQRTLGPSLEAKAWARWAWRNLGDPQQLGRERAVGVDLQHRW